MHHAQDEDAHVGVLELLDPDAAPVAPWEEREGVAGDLVEHRIAVTAEEGHKTVRRGGAWFEDDRAGCRATIAWLTGMGSPLARCMPGHGTSSS